MNKKSGFTLMELMVIIAIIAILGAIAVPNLMSFRTNQRLGAGAREILSAIQEARMRAIKDQVRTTITFDTATRSYNAFVDDGAGVPANAGNGQPDAGETIIVSGTLPGDISITNAPLAALVFNGRGMASADGTVTLTNAGGLNRQITVLLSGNARIQ